jgi:hypothetical protein
MRTDPCCVACDGYISFAHVSAFRRRIDRISERLVCSDSIDGCPFVALCNDWEIRSVASSDGGVNQSRVDSSTILPSFGRCHVHVTERIESSMGSLRFMVRFVFFSSSIVPYPKQQLPAGLVVW